MARQYLPLFGKEIDCIPRNEYGYGFAVGFRERVATFQAGPPRETGECPTCPYHKSVRNKAKGVRIPGGYGKCTRPGGHCSPLRVNEGIRSRSRKNDGGDNAPK